jgi:hypothetical protein
VRRDDLRRVVVRSEPAWPVRWIRKLATAVPAARVFRRQMATPLSSAIEAGTPVLSSSGRHLGVVRSLVVEVPSGVASYAVAAVGGARVILLPQRSLVERNDVAVIDERVARRLRLSA